MKNILRFIVTAALAVVSFSARSQDITAEFVEHVKNEFLGQEATASKKWDLKYCAIPGVGGCQQRAGFEIYGDARGTVRNLIDQVGRGWFLGRTTNPWSNTSVIEHWIDLKLVFNYEGSTEGKKQCFPGNFYCGMEWSTLNPQGKITIDLFADGNRVLIDLSYVVTPGHSDKPNAVTRDAMLNLSGKVREIVQRFVNRVGSDAKVELRSVQ